MECIMSAVKPKLRWYQFSLKSLMAVVVLSCVAFGILVVPLFRARRPAAAVAELKKLQCSITYDYQFRPGPGIPPGPAWLRNWLGDDVFTNVVQFRCFRSTAGDAELELLKDLPRLELLVLSQSQAGDQGLK